MCNARMLGQVVGVWPSFKNLINIWVIRVGLNMFGGGRKRIDVYSKGYISA